MNNETKRTTIGLILFIAVAVLAVIHFKSILTLIGYAFSVVAPFLIGAAIAFVMNIPMSAIEIKLFGKVRKKGVMKLARPCSILITFFLCLLIIVLIAFLVVPEFTNAIKELSLQIPTFVSNALIELEKWSEKYQLLEEEIEKIRETKIDWDEVINKIVVFLGNGVGTTALVNTMNIAGSIIGGIVNTFIAIVFSLYVLAAKEILQSQSLRVLRAFSSEKVEKKVLKIISLLNKSFRNFISGQFVEAMILGLLFLIVLSVGGFHYVILISVLIAVTSLIPIAGAFLGCIVGAFLIMVDDPMRALYFIIVFLIIQQIEGNLIYPKVVGETVGLPAMWVLAAVTIGGSLFGIMGMLIFIPLTSAAYSMLRDATKNRLEKKRLKEEEQNVSKNATMNENELRGNVRPTMKRKN